LVAILGGLGAALMWATTTMTSSRASRLIGAEPVLAWVMLIGLLVVGPVAAWHGVPDGLDWRAAGYLAVSGIGNVVGLLLTYRAYRIGKVGIIAPIASTEGAVAALIAVAAGEQLSAGQAVTLGVITLGIVLAAVASAETEIERTHHWRSVLYASGAAVTFGASLYATGHVGNELPVAWVILPARVLGVVAVALPLLVRRRLFVTREALPFVVVCGVAEVLGFVSFTLGARDSLAVAAVIASQFAGLAAILAFVLYGERLRRIQVVGVTAIAVGVGVLSALHA
jgi:drug/metabolite transporter (DMT)-like permease